MKAILLVNLEDIAERRFTADEEMMKNDKRGSHRNY